MAFRTKKVSTTPATVSTIAAVWDRKPWVATSMGMYLEYCLSVHSWEMNGVVAGSWFGDD